MKNNSELNFLEKYKFTAFFIVTLVVSAYVIIFSGFKYSLDDISKAGALGDYFGGMLNPIFALLGLFALLETIRIQSKELRTSSKALEQSQTELELTRKQTELSSNALQEQSESIKQQNFENTFFNMIQLHKNITESINFINKAYNFHNSPEDKIEYMMKYGLEEHLFSNKPIDSIYTNLKAFFNTYNTLENYQKAENYKELTNQNQANNTKDLYYEFYIAHEQYIGNYFRNIYQVLKFINSYELKNKKLYSNIFRAQFSNDELAFLFYHCASEYGNEKFMPLLIELEFLEPLPYNENINRLDVIEYINKTQKISNDYEPSKVFGKNEKWKEKVEEMTTDSK